MRVALAYSGGLDTSVAIRWLQVRYGYDVVTVTVDVGQGDDLKAIEDRARAIGAVKHYTIDAREEFARDYVMPCIRANGLYEGKYPLATALARPLIAGKVVEVARREGTSILAHGCTGKGNDQVRFDVTMRALMPNCTIIAPIRDMNMTRDEELEFARQEGIELAAESKRYSIDQNLWGRAIEGGDLEDAESEPKADAFRWVNVDPALLPDDSAYMSIEFDHGIPVAVDGVKAHPSGSGMVEMIEYANERAGRYGVGIVDHIEDRVVGIKSREVYEAPAALTIIEAHRELEKLVLTSHQLRFKQIVEQQWSILAYSGLWLEPLRLDLDRFIASTQEYVSGKVTLKMYKGSFRVVSRSSPYSLYDEGLATYTKGSTFDQSLARGFVELWGLQSMVANRVRGVAYESGAGMQESMPRRVSMHGQG
ncbi:MAG: argininosuccinate synthase [Candidatus Nitrosocaldus sp.]|nr:argininosuccinate synthase [Candidatus Nitrosocaldus sp.]MDW8275046.1 argininosuccinate synthase [Candidatus Nitrosocaldus sp.]